MHARRAIKFDRTKIYFKNHIKNQIFWSTEWKIRKFLDDIRYFALFICSVLIQMQHFISFVQYKTFKFPKEEQSTVKRIISKNKKTIINVQKWSTSPTLSITLVLSPYSVSFHVCLTTQFVFDP